MKPLIIYHGDCPDGFTAALAAWLKFGAGADYLPYDYANEALPDVKGRDVLILDFSFKRMAMQILADQAKSIVLLDHHKTAVTDLADFKCACVDIRLDLSQSGAVLAWKYFHPDKPVPYLFECVQDRDLWKWDVPGSAEYLAAVDQVPYEFEAWAALLQHTAEQRAEFAATGVALRKQFVTLCADMAKKALPVKLEGMEGWAVNCPLREMADDVGTAIMDKHGTFALMWRIEPEHGALAVSVRSPRGLPMDEIAVRFGGGGHPFACSFKLPLDRMSDLIAGDLRSDVTTAKSTRMAEAAQVLDAMESGEWTVTRHTPISYLTDEANRRNAWSVQRTQAPFCTEAGERLWSGPTPLHALSAARKALDKDAKRMKKRQSARA